MLLFLHAAFCYGVLGLHSDQGEYIECAIVVTMQQTKSYFTPEWWGSTKRKKVSLKYLDLPFLRKHFVCAPHFSNTELETKLVHTTKKGLICSYIGLNCSVRKVVGKVLVRET